MYDYDQTYYDTPPMADVEGELQEIGEGGIEQINSIEQELFRYFDNVITYVCKYICQSYNIM